MNHLEFEGQGVAVRPITVFLHGFPSIRSTQNRDIAKKTAETTGRHCYVPLYPGLGFSDGVFSFKECRSLVEDFVSRLIEKHGQIDLVGHSWGGYLALGLAAKHGQKIGRLVLMSPLLNFFGPDDSDDYFKETAKDYPQLSLGDVDQLVKEFVEVGTSTTALSLAQKVDPLTQVVLLQAADDDTTPAKFAEELLVNFRELPIYEVVDTDHSFVLNRESATRNVINALEMGWKAD